MGAKLDAMRAAAAQGATPPPAAVRKCCGTAKTARHAPTCLNLRPTSEGTGTQTRRACCGTRRGKDVPHAAGCIVGVATEAEAVTGTVETVEGADPELVRGGEVRRGS